MATEMLEYRPGKWVKVIDGRIVGRATADEVAAWRAQKQPSATSPVPLMLEIDLDRPGAEPKVEPAQALDIPRRPAFERRGKKLPPSECSMPSKEHANCVHDVGEGHEQSTGRPPAAPPEGKDGGLGSLTLEMAITKDAAARRRSGERGQEEGAPVMVRRKLPVIDSLPPPGSHDKIPAEVTPLSKLASRPPVTAAATPSIIRRPAEAPAATPASQDVLAEEPAIPESQNASYWWICNVHRQPVEVFLKEWAPRYRAKFGHDVALILCHADDLAAARASGFDADVSPLLQPGHFYLVVALRNSDV